MKNNVLKASIVVSALLISTALFSVGSGGGCSATAYCFDNGEKYDEVTCTGALSCVKFSGGVDCDMEETLCPPPPNPN